MLNSSQILRNTPEIPYTIEDLEIFRGEDPKNFEDDEFSLKKFYNLKLIEWEKELPKLAYNICKLQKNNMDLEIKINENEQKLHQAIKHISKIKENDIFCDAMFEILSEELTRCEEKAKKVVDMIEQQKRLVSEKGSFPNRKDFIECINYLAEKTKALNLLQVKLVQTYKDCKNKENRQLLDEEISDLISQFNHQLDLDSKLEKSLHHRRLQHFSLLGWNLTNLKENIKNNFDITEKNTRIPFYQLTTLKDISYVASFYNDENNQILDLNKDGHFYFKNPSDQLFYPVEITRRRYYFKAKGNEIFYPCTDINESTRRVFKFDSLSGMFLFDQNELKDNDPIIDFCAQVITGIKDTKN